jgi:hypothetical protein
MVMSDALENAIADLKGKIAERVALLKDDENWRELQRLYSGLGVLEELCKLPKTDLTALLDIGGADAGPRIGKYDFIADQPLDAAKKFLRMIAPKQKVASMDEIMAALKSGGLTPSRDELRLSLSRSTVEIYKAGDDIYGLLENFPQIKQQRGTPGRKKSTNGASVEAVVEIMRNQAPISLNKAVELAEAQEEKSKG